MTGKQNNDGGGEKRLMTDGGIPMGENGEVPLESDDEVEQTELPDEVADAVAGAQPGLTAEEALEKLDDFNEDEYDFSHWEGGFEEVEEGSVVQFYGGEMGFDEIEGVVTDTVDDENNEFRIITKNGEEKVLAEGADMMEDNDRVPLSQVWNEPDDNNDSVTEKPEDDIQESSPEWMQDRSLDFDEIEEDDVLVVRDEDGSTQTIEVVSVDDENGIVEGRDESGVSAGVFRNDIEAGLAEEPDKEVLARLENNSVRQSPEREQINSTLEEYGDEIENVVDELPNGIHRGEGLDDVPDFDDQAGGGFDRLDGETAGKIRSAIKEEVGDDEAVNNVWQTMQSMKQASSMKAGSYSDHLVRETFDLEGDVRPSDDDVEISEAEQKAFALYAGASQEVMRKTHGRTFETHRGVGEHELQELATEWLEDPTATQYELEGNGSANYTVSDEIAQSFGSENVTLSRRTTPEEVINANDMIRGNWAASPGAQEGEVWRAGGEQTVHPWEVNLGTYNDPDAPIFEQGEDVTMGDYQKPIDELDKQMVDKMGTVVKQLDSSANLSETAEENLERFAERYEEVMDDGGLSDVVDDISDE